MNRSVVLFVLTGFLPSLPGLHAQGSETTAEPSVFEVTRPELDGTRPEVERGITVEGTATLAPGEHLWVFCRRADFEPLWWPQREGVVDPENGTWKVYARLGEPHDVGWRFDVAVGVVGEREHARLRDGWLKQMKTGVFRPIEMPELQVPPALFSVMKTGND